MMVHGDKYIYNKTIEREKIIQDKKYNLQIIREHDWEKNQTS